MPENRHVPLSGSAKHPVTGSETAEAIDPEEQFRVSVWLRRRNALPPTRNLSNSRLRDRLLLSHAEYLSRHGAVLEDSYRISIFAGSYNLTVVGAEAAGRKVILEGRAGDFARAFGVNLKTVLRRGRKCRVREGRIFVPAELSDLITSVTGLDNRPFARPHVRLRQRSAHAAAGEAVAVSTAPAAAGFTPLEVAALYKFPAGLDGTGQTIAILELGGGFRNDELDTYFGHLGIRRPNVRVAPFLTSGQNLPGANALDPFSYDTEVMLDIQIAAAIAPGANIAVYFAPDDSDDSFLSAMSAIIHDTTNNPSVVSISWGGPEKLTTEQFRNELDDLLQTAAHLGITVCVATGDNGSTDFASNDPRAEDGAHVDFPASSPFALACGGTKIYASAGEIQKEEVWNDGPDDATGGGISRYFELPDYQQGAGVPRAVSPDGPVKRGVPDVAGNASPASGYRILCDGQMFPDATRDIPALGGTSAVAPLWAALIALLNQATGQRCGFLNPLLYTLAKEGKVFRNITEGTNGAYSASGGWDPCTGLGTPNGTELLAALRSKG